MIACKGTKQVSLYNIHKQTSDQSSTKPLSILVYRCYLTW